MATVLFYNFILLSSTFFVWLSEKMRYKLDRWLVLGVAFLLVFIPSAIRYGVGADYFSYLGIYESGSYINYQFKEPAFYFINWFLDSIGAHFQWLFAVFAFIFTAVAFKAYPRKNAWLLHLVIFSMIWFTSFNIMRHTVMMVISILAILNFFEKRYLSFLILTAMASLFHQTGLILMAAGLAALIPLNHFFKARISSFVFIGFIVFTYFFMAFVLSYMEQILNIVGFSKYAGYFSSSKHFIARDFGTGLGVLAKLLFSVYVIFQTKHLIKANKNYWLLLVLIFAYAVSVIIANDIVIFNRMANIFYPAPILASYLLWILPSNRLLNRTVVIFFITFLLMSFVKSSFGVPTTYSDPNINPYQTILSL